MSEGWTRAEAQRREKGFQAPVGGNDMETLVLARRERDAWHADLMSAFEDWKECGSIDADMVLPLLKATQRGYHKACKYLAQVELRMVTATA